jgi:hypothetical protein
LLLSTIFRLDYGSIPKASHIFQFYLITFVSRTLTVTQLILFCIAKFVYEIIAGFKFISNTDIHMILFSLISYHDCWFVYIFSFVTVASPYNLFKLAKHLYQDCNVTCHLCIFACWGYNVCFFLR